MALPLSGLISMSDIHAEFGLGLNLGAYRGVRWYTPQGDTGLFPDTNIAFSHFYNKTKTPPDRNVSFYVSADNRGEMFFADAALNKGASLGGSWSTANGNYEVVFGPTTVLFTVGTPIYFCSEGYNTTAEGGPSFIFTDIDSSRFECNLLRVDEGPTPIWRNDIPWVYNPALGSRGFLRTTDNEVAWKWFFSLTLLPE